MSADITSLGLAVDSSQVTRAKSELDHMATSGDRAAKSGSGMEDAWGKVKMVLAGLALGATAAEFIKMADASTLMNARLRMAVGAGEEFRAAQQSIYTISQAMNTGLAETAALYTKLHEPVKRLGGTTAETTAITEAFAASLRVGGASTQEAAAATLQFAQAMGSGKLQGDEFRSLAEASPRFMKALAEGMGTPIEKLKELGTEGKLTADVVGNALMASLGKLKTEVGQIPDTFGGAMTRLKNDLLVAVSTINESGGITLGVAGLVESVRTGLIPALSEGVGGAVAEVAKWLGDSKTQLEDVWIATKGLAGDMLQIVGAVATLVVGVGKWAVESGAVATTLEAARLLIAGIKDGVTIVGAALAFVGSTIISLVLSPLNMVLDAAASIAGVFDTDMETRLLGLSNSIREFAQSGRKYAEDVFTEFSNGESAVAKLGASMEESAQKTNQMRAALAAGSISAADAARETQNMKVKAAEAAVGLRTLKGATAELTDEQKKHAKETEKLAKAGTDYLATLRAKHAEVLKELDLGRKLTDAEKQQLELTDKLTNKKITMTAAERAAAVATIASTASLQDNIRWMEASRKANDDARDAIEKHGVELDDLVKAQREANATLGLSEKALRMHEAALLDDKSAAALLRAEMTQLVDPDAAAELRRQAEQWAELARLKRENFDKGAAIESRNAWMDTITDIGVGFGEAIMGGARSAKEYVVNLFSHMLIRVPLQTMMTGVAGGVGSMFSGGANAGGAGGGAGSLLSTAGSFFGGGMGALGSFGATGFMSTLTGTGLGTSLGAAGSLIQGGNIMGGAGMGLGAIAPYALAAMALYKMWKSRDHSGTPHEGAMALADPTGLTQMLQSGGGGLGFHYATPGGQGQFGAGVRGTAATSAGILNALGSGFTVATGYADDTSEDGSFGALRISRGGQSVVDWESGRTSKWAPKTFSDGEAGWTEYLNSVAASTKDAIESIGLPEWAQSIVTSLGDTPTLDQLAGAADYIKTTTSALVDMGVMVADLGGPFARITSLSSDAQFALAEFAGGVEAFVQKTAAYLGAYYSEAEQNAISGKGILQRLSGVGIDAGAFDERSDLRAAMDALDITTEQGQQQMATLLDVAQQFAGVSDYLQAQGETLTSLAEAAPTVAALEVLQEPQQIIADSTTRTAEGVAELKAEIAALKNDVVAALAQVAAYGQKTAGLLDRAMPDGDALSTRAAT